MHWIDIAIFSAYMLAMLGVGFFFMRKNKGGEDYYVGGRKMDSFHVGLSVVATDVGGGFSIGLGGLGFIMGLSGSWMLFTGLLGAWLSAVLLIPRVKRNPALANALTFPDFFRFYYGANAALLAGIISAIGYVGFTSSQMLAGAKLASGTFPELSLETALYAMAAIAIAYTAMGGLKAVVYTDTVQWLILMFGLIGIGLPISYFAIGGFDGIRNALPPDMLSPFHLSWNQAVNWTVTIVPIWFVGMTLYQRIFACKDEQTAKRAWFIAGLLEWPVMAFMGVTLGLFARVAAEQGQFTPIDIHTMDPETGIPMLLRTVLPVGMMGLMMSAYFSAILSTADSCLMAASGNIVSDIIGRFWKLSTNHRHFVKGSQGATLILGMAALLLAARMSNVLQLMLHSYAFMISGLFVPVLGALFLRRHSPGAATGAMVAGGTTTILLEVFTPTLPLGLDANVFGIAASAAVFSAGTALSRHKTYM